MAKKGKRLAIILGGLAVLGTSAFLWSFFKPRDDPRIAGPTPANMTLLPRSRYQSKPWINLPWFGGKRLEYPARSIMPKGWKENPLESGVLTWKSSPPPAPPKGSATVVRPPDYTVQLFMMMDWIDPSKRVWLQAWPRVYSTTGPQYASCPYVFGDKPVRFDLRWPYRDRLSIGLMPPGEFSIVIPPLHRPAPAVGPKTVKVKDWTLTFTMVEWLGPSFGAKFQVTAEGLKKGQQLFILSDYSKMASESTIDTSFAVSAERPATITASRYMPLYAALVEPRSVRGTLTFKAMGKTGIGGTYSQIHLKDMKGNHLAEGFHVEGLAYMNSSPQNRKITAIKINGTWAGFAFESESSGSRSEFFKGRKDLRPGSVEVTFYKAVDMATFEVKDLLPDMQALLAKAKV